MPVVISININANTSAWNNFIGSGSSS